jgi:hypothetical protein
VVSSICRSGHPSTRRRPSSPTPFEARRMPTGTRRRWGHRAARGDRRLVRPPRGVPGLVGRPADGRLEGARRAPAAAARPGAGDIVVHRARPTRRTRSARSSGACPASDDPAAVARGTKPWINSPGNRRRCWIHELRAPCACAERRRASDECYAELGWDGAWAHEPSRASSIRA